MRIVGAILCFVISVSVQAVFVWIASRVARLDCNFREALTIAAICSSLLLVPKAGLLLSAAAFILFLLKWLRANGTEAMLVFFVFCLLDLLLLLTGVS